MQPCAHSVRKMNFFDYHTKSRAFVHIRRINFIFAQKRGNFTAFVSKIFKEF